MTTGLTLPPRRRVAAATCAGLGWSRPAYIGLSANRFQRINDAGVAVDGPTLFLDVVLVASNAGTSKRFYGNKPYDPTSAEPPVCFSDNGTGPSTQAATPQAPTCAMCPHNAVGSATSKMTGKPTKACQDRKKLAVVIPGGEDRNCYTLDLPPNALSGLRSYTAWLVQQRHPVEPRSVDPSDMITRLSFPDPSDLGKMDFKPVGWEEDEATAELIALVAPIDGRTGVADRAVGADDVACDPARVQALLAPQAAANVPIGALQAQLPGPQRQPASFAGDDTIPLHIPIPTAEQGPPRIDGRTRAARAMKSPASAPLPAPPQVISPGAPLQVPEFLQRNPDNTLPSMPSIGTDPERFGMSSPPPAPAALTAALASAMALPTRGR